MMTYFMQLFSPIHSPADNAQNILEANTSVIIHVNMKALRKILEHLSFGKYCEINNYFQRPNRITLVDTLFIVRLRPNMSMRRAVIIFLVHKMEVENLILLSTQVLLRSNEVSLA